MADRQLMVQTSDYLKQSVAKQAAALRARKIDPNFFEQVLLNALVANPQLAECSKVSLYKACADAVDFGVLPDGRHGAIVPVRNKGKQEAQFWPMLAGLLSKVRKELPDISINSWPVFIDPNGEGDEFEDHRGTQPRLVHKPNPHVLRSDDNLYAVYAVVFHAGNPVPEFEVMYRPEIDAFRKSNRGPWTTHFVRMAQARPLKRLMNRLPLTGSALQMIHSDPDRDTEDGVIIEAAEEVLDPVAVEREPLPLPEPEPEPAPKPAPKPAPRQQRKPKPAPAPEPEPPAHEEEPEYDGGGDDDYDPTLDLA